MSDAIAVTGHRQYLLGGPSAECEAALRRVAEAWLARHPVRAVISGLADGWDAAVARSAIALGLPLTAALAYRSQAAHWPEAHRRGHDRLLAQASEIYVASEEKAHGVYTRRDRWVLERGDRVLAMNSGAPGGAARAVQMAGKLGKPVVNLWEAYLAALDEPTRSLAMLRVKEALAK